MPGIDAMLTFQRSIISEAIYHLPFRVQQEFYWPGIHEYVTRYVASCDLCQRNVSKGTVAKAPMEKLHIGDSVLLLLPTERK